jgi:RNA recognition motif-containing protein
MEQDNDAASAIAALNGYEMNGRQLRVNEAENKPRRTSPAITTTDTNCSETGFTGRFLSNKNYCRLFPLRLYFSIEAEERLAYELHIYGTASHSERFLGIGLRTCILCGIIHFGKRLSINY